VTESTKIVIESRRKHHKTLNNAYPGATFIDVTSKGDAPWVKFSPFYPHGGIPVPFSDGVTAQSVEGIWQGLKVFEEHGIDPSKFKITSMRGIKRTMRRFGPIRGHRKGVNGAEMLDYRAARYLIYLPSYRWVLAQHLANEVSQLAALAAQKTVVLLDYETNTDVDNLEKPLSHAALIRRYVLNEWPNYASGD